MKLTSVSRSPGKKPSLSRSSSSLFHSPLSPPTREEEEEEDEEDEELSFIQPAGDLINQFLSQVREKYCYFLVSDLCQNIVSSFMI